MYSFFLIDLSKHFTASSALWLEFCNLERQYGQTQQLRQTFKRALSCTTDWPQCISEEWLLFEREFGTLDEVLKCLDTIKSEVKTTPQHLVRNVDARVESRQAKGRDHVESRQAKVRDQRQKKRPFEEEERNDRFKKGL